MKDLMGFTGWHGNLEFRRVCSQPGFPNSGNALYSDFSTHSVLPEGTFTPPFVMANVSTNQPAAEVVLHHEDLTVNELNPLFSRQPLDPR